MSKLPYPAKGKKLHWTKCHANYERVILDSLVSSTAETDEGKAREIADAFASQKGPAMVSQDGRRRYYKTPLDAMTSWLQGIGLDIPVHHYDIIQLAKACGSVGPDLTDKQEDHIVQGYFGFMANHVFRVIIKHAPEDSLWRELSTSSAMWKLMCKH